MHVTIRQVSILETKNCISPLVIEAIIHNDILICDVLAGSVSKDVVSEGVHFGGLGFFSFLDLPTELKNKTQVNSNDMDLYKVTARVQKKYL